jgi:hypothetical protein
VQPVHDRACLLDVHFYPSVGRKALIHVNGPAGEEGIRDRYWRGIEGRFRGRRRSAEHRHQHLA